LHIQRNTNKVNSFSKKGMFSNSGFLKGIVIMADKASKVSTQTLPLIDPPSVHDIYVDEATGFYSRNGTLRITFSTIRANHENNPATMQRVVVNRLVMPLSTAEAMLRNLVEIVERSKAQATSNLSTRTVQ